MPTLDRDPWTDLLERTLAAYDAPLLRQTAARLAKPRTQWPADELLARSLAATGNAALLDRRLKDLDGPGRQLLALIGHSRQYCWPLGNLVEMLLALGHADGLNPVIDLVQSGLLYPTTLATLQGEKPVRIRTLERLLTVDGAPGQYLFFTTPLIATRALAMDLPLPNLADADPAGSPLAWQEADGLEFPLRLAVLWQHVAESSLRRTQQGTFFKRDHERVGEDPLLNGPAADQPAAWPDPGFLCAALATAQGLLTEGDGELRAGDLPAAWNAGLPATLAGLFASLLQSRAWDPVAGHLTEAPSCSPFASAGVLALALLARLAEEQAVEPRAIEEWLHAHHPYWMGDDVRPSRQQPWVEAYLLGVCYQLRIVQAARDADGRWLVRLSAMGRWLVGLTDTPPPSATFPQTLLVQPNLEIVAYRQGLTPSLIARLTRFAAWTRLGAACTLQLAPETVYRGLERGESFDSIRLALEQHGTRALPAAVIDSLRTWSNKRDRLTLWPTATLLEFDRPSDLNDALARGLPGVRIGETLAVVAEDSAIDYRQFRLLGTRDYALPPEKCVSVDGDGVTLTVDTSRSDLLLETEIPTIAESLPGAPVGSRRYRLTPASLAGARGAGWTPGMLEAWFAQRVGQAMTPAARLLLGGTQAPPVELQRHLVLHVATAELADGLTQWPATRELFARRLGPTTLAVVEERLAALQERLRELGITFEEFEQPR